MEIKNVITIDDFLVVEPCWYATSEKIGTVKDYKWRVGCVYPDHKDECEFAFADFGDLRNKDVYREIIGKEFVVNLIALFKKSGQEGIRNWIKERNKGE